MYGALLGDIIGSPYEFDRGDKTKEFPLFSPKSHFTDDTVMTIAIAEALMNVGKNASEVVMKNAFIHSLKKWGHRYPDAGYGARFSYWLRSEKSEPYNSFGNGSAMRVSPIGFLYNTLERTCEVARWSSEITHNHPEGIKGAQATATVMYLARKGKSKSEINRTIELKFHYNLKRTLDEIRPTYYHVESCQKTVPEAVIAFLEGNDFEDVIRNAVSIGGDTDTLAAIAGGMAESFYGVPAELERKAEKILDTELVKVVQKFRKFFFELKDT